MIKWMLENHKSSISCAELRKYLPIFATDDQKFIDEFLDNEQRELNERQPELDRIAEEAAAQQLILDQIAEQRAQEDEELR
jgi:hypothetical protein